jgi:hypothetical protein
MKAILTKEEQLLRDVQHLATEIVNLTGGTTTEADIRTAIEMGQTTWHKLADMGQVRGPWDFFRALPSGQVEWLTAHTDCPAMNRSRVCSMLEMKQGHHLSMWLHLESAGFCSDEEYAAAKAACAKPDVVLLQRAEQRWSQAQAELEQEGVLPFHRPAALPPLVKVISSPIRWSLKSEVRWACRVCGREMAYSQPISLALSALLVGTFIQYHEEHCQGIVKPEGGQQNEITTWISLPSHPA